MQSKRQIKFGGDIVELKFDNYALFRLAAIGAEYKDLLLCKGADADKYCAAWACVLGVAYDGNAREFLGKFDKMAELNGALIGALEEAGVIEPEEDKMGENAAKKNKSC